MPIGPSISHAAALLVTAFGLAVTGLHLSGVAYLSHHLADELAKYTRINRPDPTLWMRLWRRFYYRNFDPYGKRASKKFRGPVKRGTVYQLAVGAVAICFVMGIYGLFSGATLGAMLVSYYSLGVVPNMSAFIHNVAASCVLLGIAIILYAHGQRKFTHCA